MVHETRFLTFWRDLNTALGQRRGRPVDLDTAAMAMGCCASAAEAADLLHPHPAALGHIDAGLAPGWQRDFDEIFGEC